MSEDNQSQLPDLYVATGSWDKTARLWNLKT